jgi:hypothetical protein
MAIGEGFYKHTEWVMGKEKVIRVHVSMPESLHAKVKAIAEAKAVSVSTLIRMNLVKAVEWVARNEAAEKSHQETLRRMEMYKKMGGMSEEEVDAETIASRNRCWNELYEGKYDDRD